MVNHIIQSHSNDDLDFTAILYPFNAKVAIWIWKQHLYSKYVKYICEHRLEQAKIVMPNLEILRECPSLRYLCICPASDSPLIYDYTPLYDMEEIRDLTFSNHIGDRIVTGLDCSKIKGLISLGVDNINGATNYNRLELLKTLHVGKFRSSSTDLTNLFCSTQLDTLVLHESLEHSLNGIERSPKMQYVELSYNRQLCDITALKGVRNSIRSLNIYNCSKIEDFSVIGELENLEKLTIVGGNVLPNLDFIKPLKNLKTLELGVTVADGNLTPCLDLQWAHLWRNKKHYNLRDQDLPKIAYTHGNEDIEEWRRLE